MLGPLIEGADVRRLKSFNLQVEQVWCIVNKTKKDFARSTSVWMICKASIGILLEVVLESTFLSSSLFQDAHGDKRHTPMLSND